MKKVTLIISIAGLLVVSACGNSNKQTENNDEQSIATSDKTTKEEVPKLQTKEGFEKMLKDYGIAVYPDAKFKNIKRNDDGDFVITYTIDDLSSESHEKVKEYIANAFASLKEDGWNTEPSFHIAMKKEGDHKVAIQINEAYVTDYKFHELSISYGTTD